MQSRKFPKVVLYIERQSFILSDLEGDFPGDEVGSGLDWTRQIYIILELKGALRAYAICSTEEAQMTFAQSYKASWYLILKAF